MLISAAVTTLCVKKLIETGLKYEIYCYSRIVEKVLGRKGRHLLDVMIFLSQFACTISQAVFVIKSLSTSVNQAFGINTPIWYYSIGLVFVLTPIAWVRDISRFSFTFLLGNLLLALTVMVVSIHAVQ
jgi:amino acid permease